MPDANGKFKGISLSGARFWPGHKDWVPSTTADIKIESDDNVKGAFARVFAEEVRATHEAYRRHIERLDRGFYIGRGVAHERSGDEPSGRQPDDPGHLGELARREP